MDQVKMDLIKPKKLKQGDTIGIVAPSGWGIPELGDQAAANLKSFGFNVMMHPQANARHFVSAGTPEERVQALHDVFLNPEIDAVFALKGGLRAMQMLDGIDYDLIRKNPKIFIGYSDITFLLSAFNARAGLVTFHGLTLSRYGTDKSRNDQETTLSFLQGKLSNIFWPETEQIETLRQGEAEGILYGGNFCLLTSLMALGNQYMPDLKGKILLIEDIGEEIRQIDRMFSILKISGALNDIKGLVIGHMTDIADTGDNYRFDCSVRDLILEHTEGLKIPVVFGAPFGHDTPNWPFPIGIKAKLTAPENGTPQLQLLESPFAD
jgi:muramoyltetrapeptide carboxypeptidase